MSHVYSICKEMLTSSPITSNALRATGSIALLELPCYLFILEHFLIYLPLICVALFHRKQLKANESKLHVTLDL